MHKESINLGFLIFQGYIKEKNDRWLLTPKGAAFLKKMPAHTEAVTGIIQSQNKQRDELSRRLNEILSMRKASGDQFRGSKKAWELPKPAAKPKKRRLSRP